MKRLHPWHQLQKDHQGWEHIAPDLFLVDLLSNKDWCLDLTYCHDSLRVLLEPHHVNKAQTDFFIITELELSKLPLDILFRLIRTQYNNSESGGYVALLSYYITSNKKYCDLNGSYSENINKVFVDNFDYVNKLENKSSVIDFPINQIKDGQLLEGTNFLFVHPNIRYLLWK